MPRVRSLHPPESPRPLRLTSPRAGWTLIELLVVMAVLAVLSALVMPAVQSAREASRRGQCADRLRQVALAVANHHTAHRRYPALGYIGWNNGYVGHANWVVQILAELDQATLAQKWNHDLSHQASPNRELGATPLPILTCPSDLSLTGRGDLSFAANGGAGYSVQSAAGVLNCPVAIDGGEIDLNGNGVTCPLQPVADGQPGDRELLAMTGIFFLENWPPGRGTVRHHRSGSILDGESHTLLLLENVRAGADPQDARTGWSSTSPRRVGIYWPPDVCGQHRCAPGNVDTSRANLGDARINAALRQAEGEAPWPSSFHGGGVNAAFADGRVKFLSESIAGSVYYSLLTSAGTRLPLPLRDPHVGSFD